MTQVQYTVEPQGKPLAVMVSIAALEQLVKALKDAQQSLETISMLAGRATYGNPPIETFMQRPDEIRGYAASRAGCATEALSAGRAALANAEPTWWQKIETAPKDYVTEFDGWNGDRVPNVSWAHPEYSSKGHYAWCVSEYEHHNGWVNTEVKGLTHWMPLPPSPGDTP